MKTFGVLAVALILFSTLAILGVRYGLPDQGHILSYNCDETIWIEALGHLTAEHGYNPNPELNSPSFALLPFATASWIAMKSGWISPNHDKNYLHDHPEQFGRFYLIGRLLQAGSGVLLIYTVWLVARKMYGLLCANLACLLVALTPGIIAASHFMQPNLMVAAVAMGSIGLFLLYEKEPERRSLLLWGSFFGGLALSTKYSAAPLLFIVLYTSWRSAPRWKNVAFCFGCYAAGFLVGEPFILFSLTRFMALSHRLTEQVIVQTTVGAPARQNYLVVLWGFRYALPYALGGVQWLVFLGCLGWLALRRQSEGLSLLLIALAIFAVSIASVGTVASPARVLIVAPLISLVIARLISQGWERSSSWGRTILSSASVLILCSSGIYAVMITRLHRDIPTQKVTTEWILSHVPRNSKIGVPRVPYYWSPDILLESYYWPARVQNPYAVENLQFSIERARRVDYVMVAMQDRYHAQLSGPGGMQFLQWLDSGQDFELVNAYERHLRWGPFRWSRPERYGLIDDDLWAYSYFIYKKRVASHAS